MQGFDPAFQSVEAGVHNVEAGRGLGLQLLDPRLKLMLQALDSHPNFGHDVLASPKADFLNRFESQVRISPNLAQHAK